MSQSARKSVATKELLRHVAKRATGRLSVASASGALTISLLQGDIIGAESPSDPLLLLRRFRRVGALSAARAVELEAQARTGSTIFGALLDEVPGDVLEPVLYDRFRDNIVGFVAQEDLPRFEALPGVFVDNMQMGQTPARLLDSAFKDADLARRIDPELPLVRGTLHGRDELEQAVLDAVGTEAHSAYALLDRLDLEPWSALALVAQLVERGALREPKPPPAQGPFAEEVPTLTPADADASAEPYEAPEPGAGAGAGAADAFASDLPDEPTVPTPPPDDMSMWLDSGDHLTAEDLAFFEDQEDDRGAGAGGFTTEAHNLDRVSVDRVGVGKGGDSEDAPSAEPALDVADEVLEADEAPTARFSAPMLSEADALEKIEVCNDVLRRVAAAFDAADGPGRGRSAIQLLVDGSPSKFTALLHDLTVGRAGDLPVDDVLANLASRPPTEHRQLINNALKNVIERALSSAADELPDDAFDDVYESVAGYNQRLGL